MRKKRVFISSVQSEFATERQMLFEYLGTGTRDIIKLCRNAKLREPEFEQTTLKTTQKILDAIRQNPQITIPELAKITGISDDGISLLERIGAKKGGYWKTKEQP